MKVAIVVEQLDPARGGAETSTLEMAAALAALDVDVTLVTSLGPAAWPHDRLRVLPLHPRGISRLARTKDFIRRAAAACADPAFDVVHAVLPCPICDVYQPRGGTYAGTIERSLALGGPGWRGRLRKLGRRLNLRQQYLARVEREMLGRADPPVVAALSEYVARQVRALAPHLPPGRLVTVFGGVETPVLGATERARRRATLRAALGVSPAEPLVVFVAHNFKLKGLGELLGAMAVAPPRDRAPWRLLVVGRDHERPYRRRAERLSVADRVRFLGPRSDVHDLIMAADLLAHPTWYDPCSRVVLEAFALGTPVVTTRCNGAAEILEGRDFDAVIEAPTQLDALADAISRCLAPAAAAAAQAAAADLRELVSMRRHAAELRRLYDRVVERGRGRRVARAAVR